MAAERFGWSRRNPAPRSMRDGRVARSAGAWRPRPIRRIAWPRPARRAHAAGRHACWCSRGTQDLGTGTYTVMTQVAADDARHAASSACASSSATRRMPKAPVSGGSMTAASVGPAVQRAPASALREKLAAMRRVAADGARWRAVDGARAIGATRAAERGGRASSDANSRLVRRGVRRGARRRRTSAIDSRAAHRRDLQRRHAAQSRRRRAASCRAASCGASAMALFEESLLDAALRPLRERQPRRVPRAGECRHRRRSTSRSSTRTTRVQPARRARHRRDRHHRRRRGAIANAVYHATGKRVRDLPITLDKIA